MKNILLSAFFALALTVTGAFSTAHAEVVNIGISTVGLYELPTEISKRKGFYQEEGLDVRKIVVRSPLHVPALLAGELDYSTITGLILGASVQGMPLKSVMGWFDRPLHMLIARANIKRLTDLKDKRVAVSGFGSIPHVMLREALAGAGMNPDKDIIVLALGGSGDRLAALAAGIVDATPLDVAYIQRTEKLGYNNLLYLGDVVNLRLGGFAVSNDKIQRNPEQITRVVRATLKGVRFMKINKPETMAIMRDYLKISGDYVEKIYLFALKSLNEDGLVAKNSLDNEIRLAREQLKVKDEVPESRVAEWKFIKDVLAKR
ncbi:MAG TPA: ABC transporter substrate-binding protein [Candidatus Limnocylindrales bacterium]|nr:ABC transporter substrate-binding protein [Candidatus Limnocylindrales bacterium]